MGRRIELFRDRAGEIRLPAAQNLGQRLHPPGHFGVITGERRHLRVRLGPLATARSAQNREGQRKHCKNHRRAQEFVNGDRDGEKFEQKAIIHGANRAKRNEQR